MKETDLYEQLARYLSLKHPELDGLWHFDLAGVNNPSRYTRSLYGRLNRRAWPDFCLPIPAFMPETVNLYHGLYLELKKPGTRIRKRSGEWASEHIAEQAQVLDALSNKGYIAEFAVGLDQSIEYLESYLEGVRP